MTDEFSFKHDFRLILWKETIWVNFLRSFFAGLVWSAFAFYQKDNVAFTFLFFPLAYFFVLVPLAAAASFLSSLGVRFAGWFVACLSLMVFVGDPFVFIIHKVQPKWVPVEKFGFINFDLTIFVIEEEKRNKHSNNYSREEDKSGSTTKFDDSQSKSVEGSGSTSSTNTSVPATTKYDQAKWNALLKYDNDIASIADKIRPFGQKWVDEFASSYLALNDKQYLPEIEHKILDAARREAEKKEQESMAIARAEAERKEQLRILAEKQKKAYEEQQKARLQEQERLSQATKKQIKLWQNWLIRNTKILAIGGVIVFFVGVIVTVALWQRNIMIEEEARLAEERSQERIAREQAEERARIAEERQKIVEAHRRKDQEQTEIPKSGLPVTSIPAPVVQVGDSYTYESIDADNPGPSITTKRTITSKSDKIILSVLNISRANAKPRNLYFTNEWNLIGTRNADNSGFDYSPPLKYFDFPLYPGKAWQQTTTETNVKTRATRIHKISGTVGQWEDVSVPAGTFRAIKVSLQTELFDQTTGEKINGTDTSWYVPEIRRSVKSLTTGKDAKKQLIQLVQYEFAASASTEQLDEKNLTVESVKNATYFIPVIKEKIKLSNGEWSRPVPDSSFLRESVSIQKVIFGDLNNDGIKDAAVIMYYNGGGSGSFYQIAAVLSKNGRPVYVATHELGDRIEVKKILIENNTIIISLVSPRFFPGKKAILEYKVSNNKLIGPKSPFL